MEWLAGEKTKVVGTFPPRKRGWTGYVEKDTAGQTNVYSIEVCNISTHTFFFLINFTLFWFKNIVFIVTLCSLRYMLQRVP